MGAVQGLNGGVTSDDPFGVNPSRLAPLDPAKEGTKVNTALSVT
jgi:hypothetical protein